MTQSYSLIELSAIWDELSSDELKIRCDIMIRRTRVGAVGTIVFIDVCDGTIVGDLKTLASKDTYLGDKYEFDSVETPDEKGYKTLIFEQLGDSSFLSPGCAVSIEGKLVKSPEGTTQKFEVQVHCLRVIGGVEDPEKYPIQKSTEKHLIKLRQMPFERPQAQVTQALFRVRAELLFAIQEFFHHHRIPCVDPNILTSSDCEGAGELFGVSPHMFSKDASGVDIPVGLTVSSQLPLEALVKGLRHVYTCQKSFRAEKSDTSKHLAEFLHVEYEGQFITFDELLSFTEDFVKHCIKTVLDRCKAEFDYFESKFAPEELRGSRKMLEDLVVKPFARVKHCEAVEMIQKDLRDKVEVMGDDGKIKRLKMAVYPTVDGDLESEHEKYIVRKYGGFVFVTHWPLKIKSFYMKQCDDKSGECESFDLLAPRVGEMFGGSMREWRYEKLDAEMKRRSMDVKPLQWYIDLRKSGSSPHGGWGLGFDRLLMFLTGVPSVRDVVPFPVYYGHCPY